MCAIFSVTVDLHLAVLGQSGSGCCGTLNATDRQTNGLQSRPLHTRLSGISAHCDFFGGYSRELMLAIHTDLDTRPGSIQLLT